MHKMVPADGKTISVSRDHPDRKIGVGDLDSGCDCRSTAVDRMEAVGIHVIREPAGTSDPGYKDKFFPFAPECRHIFLGLSQDGIIAAARTPANRLV